MKFHNCYDPKPISPGLDFTGMDEVCNQQLAEECEIRNIISQFEAGKIQDLPAVRQPLYNDQFITPKSFEEAKNLVEKVKNDFYSLPVDVQRQFGDFNGYLQDTYNIAQGDEATIARYNAFNAQSVANVDTSVSQPLAEPISDINSQAPASNPSSSLSAGDTKSS